MKKAVAIILSLIMVAMMCPLAVFAEGGYKVIFVDGVTYEIISEIEVDNLDDITEQMFPEVPEHEGFMFFGWDGYIDDETGEIVFIADYIDESCIDGLTAKFSVKLVDSVTGEQFAAIEFDLFNFMDVEIPEIPEHEGYIFIGFEFGESSENEIVLIARYIEIEEPEESVSEDDFYSMVFVDGLTGEVISRYEFDDMAELMFPEPKEYEGYAFMGWNFEIDDENREIIITSIYMDVSMLQDFAISIPMTFIDGLTGEVIGTFDIFTIVGAQFEGPILPVHEGYVITGFEISEDGTSIIVIYEESEISTSRKPIESVLKGDADGDGIVDTDDATEILRYMAELSTLDDSQINAADINGDGVVNTLDASYILRAVAGIEE